MRLITLIFCLSLVGCASHLNSGRDNFVKENYHKAFPDLLQAAKEGKPEAQYAIGYMYYYGNGTNENRHLAYYWIKKSADIGYKPAQEALSLIKNT